MEKKLKWNGQVVAYDRYAVPQQGELYQGRDGELTVAVCPTNKYPIFKIVSAGTPEDTEKFWMILADTSYTPSHRHYVKALAINEAQRLMTSRANQGNTQKFFILETVGVMEPDRPEFRFRNIPTK